MLVAKFIGKWLKCTAEEQIIHLSANDESEIFVEFYPNQQVCHAYYPDVNSLFEDWEYIKHVKASL